MNLEKRLTKLEQQQAAPDAWRISIDPDEPMPEGCDVIDIGGPGDDGAYPLANRDIARQNATDGGQESTSNSNYL